MGQVVEVERGQGLQDLLLILATQDLSFLNVLDKTRHLSLNEAPGFQEAYVEQMPFPALPSPASSG